MFKVFFRIWFYSMRHHYGFYIIKVTAYYDYILYYSKKNFANYYFIWWSICTDCDRLSHGEFLANVNLKLYLVLLGSHSGCARSYSHKPNNSIIFKFLLNWGHILCVHNEIPKFLNGFFFLLHKHNFSHIYQFNMIIC